MTLSLASLGEVRSVYSWAIPNEKLNMALLNNSRPSASIDKHLCGQRRQNTRIISTALFTGTIIHNSTKQILELVIYSLRHSQFRYIINSTVSSHDCMKLNNSEEQVYGLHGSSRHADCASILHDENGGLMVRNMSSPLSHMACF
jgi:hypothetical protein